MKLIEDDVSREQIEEYMALHGPKASPVMGLAKKSMDIAHALNTEVGRIILKEAMTTMNMLLKKSLDKELTDEERMEYKVLRGLVENWAVKIKNWNKSLIKIKEGLK